MSTKTKTKKTKTVELEDLGTVTLSALSAGWLEEHGDDLAVAPTTTKEAVQLSLKIIHASLQKRSPEITLEQLRDGLNFAEATALSEDVMVISGLKDGKAGEAIPESLSQASSSES